MLLEDVVDGPQRATAGAGGALGHDLALGVETVFESGVVSPTYDRSERGSDELDGLDSTDFVRPRWAVIRANGTVARSKGLHPTTSFTRRLGVGHYQIAFDASVRNCAYAVTTTDSFAGQTGVQDAPFSTDVHVFTTDSAGTRADLPFHLVVAC